MRYLFAILLVAVAPIAFSESYEFEDCVTSGNTSTRCRFTTKHLLDSLRFEADYRINYTFPCKGHHVGLRIKAGGGSEELKYVKQKTTINVRGQGDLIIYDPNPEKTKTAVIVGSCSLNILDIIPSPSYSTVNTWRTEARSQARLISKSIDLFKLSKTLEDYARWDTSHTEIMLDSIILKIDVFEDKCANEGGSACKALSHFKLIRGALEAKIEGKPELPKIPDDTLKSLSAYYKAELSKEVAVGQQMIQRFEKWKIESEKILIDILESIESYAIER